MFRQLKFGPPRPRPIGGAKWEPLKESVEPSTAAVLSRQLTEMATYLLVWGEARLDLRIGALALFGIARFTN